MKNLEIFHYGSIFLRNVDEIFCKPHIYSMGSSKIPIISLDHIDYLENDRDKRTSCMTLFIYSINVAFIIMQSTGKNIIGYTLRKIYFGTHRISLLIKYFSYIHAHRMNLWFFIFK
jgi:hypothetical protein